MALACGNVGAAQNYFGSTDVRLAGRERTELLSTPCSLCSKLPGFRASRVRDMQLSACSAQWLWRWGALSHSRQLMDAQHLRKHDTEPNMVL